MGGRSRESAGLRGIRGPEHRGIHRRSPRLSDRGELGEGRLRRTVQRMGPQGESSRRPRVLTRRRRPVRTAPIGPREDRLRKRFRNAVPGRARMMVAGFEAVVQRRFGGPPSLPLARTGLEPQRPCRDPGSFAHIPFGSGCLSRSGRAPPPRPHHLLATILRRRCKQSELVLTGHGDDKVHRARDQARP